MSNLAPPHTTASCPCSSSPPGATASYCQLPLLLITALYCSQQQFTSVHSPHSPPHLGTQQHLSDSPHSHPPSDHSSL